MRALHASRRSVLSAGLRDLGNHIPRRQAIGASFRIPSSSRHGYNESLSICQQPKLQFSSSSSPHKNTNEITSYSSFNPTSSSPDGFLSFWRSRLSAGNLRPDKAQERVAKRLQRLQQALAGYSNEAFFIHHEHRQSKNTESSQEGGSTKEADKRERRDTTNQETLEGQAISSLPALPRMPRGLYIHGPVGSGKSLLMDTFYATIDIPSSQKVRFHFHAFMQDIHKRIHLLKQEDLRTKGRNFSIDTSEEHNPIVRVALQLSRETTLLCLDEFQVTDVADALIMSQLFEVLFTFGTVVVATSNREPQDLYEGGLNRSYFLPFIGILEQHCLVHSLASDIGDYRKLLSATDPEEDEGCTKRSKQHGEEAFDRTGTRLAEFFDKGSTFLLADETRMKQIVDGLLSLAYPDESATVLQSFDIPVGFGRTFKVMLGDPNGLVGVFSFEELCHGDLGAADYRAIAQRFSVIALEDIPELSTFQHNRARRFITLVDELYEGRCALLCSARDGVSGLDNLFRGASTSRDTQEDLSDSDSFTLGETLGLEDVQTQGGQPVSTLASVRELSFAFDRAASRITEMTSYRWWNQVLQEDVWNASTEHA